MKMCLKFNLKERPLVQQVADYLRKAPEEYTSSQMQPLYLDYNL